IEAQRLAAAARRAAEERQARRRAEAGHLGGLLLGTDGQAPDRARAREALRTLDPGAEGRDPFWWLLDRLEATAEGCVWLLGRWADLGAQLERGTPWSEGQLVEALRLTGRQPLDLPPAQWDNHVESRYRADLEGPWPGDGEELDEERLMELDAEIQDRL